MFDARLVADSLERELRGVATAERAANEKRYLKSDLEFVGASVGDIRRSVRKAVKENDPWDRGQLIALVEELWRKPINERRMAAVVLLASCERLLSHEDLDRIECMIRESRTWALVDGLAAKVTGALVWRDERTGPTLDRWSTDGDFWVRRSSLLALMPTLMNGGGLEWFERYADAMLEDREFSSGR